MLSLRAICQGVTYGFTATFDVLRTIADLSVRGVKRALETAPDAVEATITRTVTDQRTHVPLAIEQRSELPNGSVKRRRLDRDSHDPNTHARPSTLQQSAAAQSSSRSSTQRESANRARNSRLSPSLQIYRARNSPSQIASTQHQIRSTDFTAGINLGFVEEIKPDVEGNEPDLSALEDGLTRRRTFLETLKNQHYEVKIPGTSQYKSSYDLVTKPLRYEEEVKRPSRSSTRYHPYEPRQHKKAGPTDIQNKRSESSERRKSRKLRGPRSEPNTPIGRCTESEETRATTLAMPGSYIEDDGPEGQPRYEEEEKTVTISKLQQAKADEDAVKYLEEQVARKAKEDAEREEEDRLERRLNMEMQMAKILERAAEARKEERRLNMEMAAKLQATEEKRRDAKKKAKREAELKRKQQTVQRQAEKEAEEARAYAERTAMVEEEDEVPLETPMQRHMQRRAREAANRRMQLLEERFPLKLWSPKDEEKMAALEEETRIKTQGNQVAQPVATPEKCPRRPGLEVQYKISPGTGFEVVNHKEFDELAPSTQLNTPEEPWQRKVDFYTRPFDKYIRDFDGNHPRTLPPKSAYGLNRQYDEYDAELEEAHDTSIEMTDVSPLPDPVQALAQGHVPAPVQAPFNGFFKGPVQAYIPTTAPSFFQAPTSAPINGFYHGPVQARVPTTASSLIQATIPASAQSASSTFHGPVMSHIADTLQRLFAPPALAVQPPVHASTKLGSVDVEMKGSPTPQEDWNVATTTPLVNGGVNVAPITNGVRLQGSSHSAKSVSSGYNAAHSASSSNSIQSKPLSYTMSSTPSTSSSNGIQQLNGIQQPNGMQQPNGIHQPNGIQPTSYMTPKTPKKADEEWLENNLSKLALDKVASVRETRRVAAERKAAEKAAAAAKAKAEAEEAARIKAAEEARLEREKAEAEAKAAEEERKKKGRRCMPTEKFVQPLSSAWESRLNTEMAKRRDAPVVTTSSGATLRAHDFGTVLSPQEWLNDEIINAHMEQTVKEANEAAGAQKFVTQNSFFYSNLSQHGPDKVKRWMSRKKVGGEKLLNLEAIFIPVNQASHWTLIVVSPEARTIEYLDSIRGDIPSDRSASIFVKNIRAWLQMELGSKYVADEWTVPQTACAGQYNGWDCGVFTVTNAKCVSLGLDPTCYDASDMALQRRRIAAEIINKGSIK